MTVPGQKLADLFADLKVVIKPTRKQAIFRQNDV